MPSLLSALKVNIRFLDEEYNTLARFFVQNSRFRDVSARTNQGKTSCSPSCYDGARQCLRYSHSTNWFASASPVICSSREANCSDLRKQIAILPRRQCVALMCPSGMSAFWGRSVRIASKKEYATCAMVIKATSWTAAEVRPTSSAHFCGGSMSATPIGASGFSSGATWPSAAIVSTCS